MTWRALLIALLMPLLLAGCDSASSSEEDGGTDSDSDSDTDSDTDSDSDADSDSDTDTDTDTDTDSDTDTDTDADGEIWGYANIEGQSPGPGISVTAQSQTTYSSYGPVTSDSAGLYTLDNLPADTYSLYAYSGVYEGEASGIVLADGASVQEDIELYEMTADAPYIYLYPETTTNVEVELLPAAGTAITLSDPPYGTGWNVTAEPSGLIDGTYDYLFYESTVLWTFQETEGWAVPASQIFDWFTANLPTMGLNGDEVQDFLDYWTVNLPTAACYNIFPQPLTAIEGNMEIDITPAPDSILRLWLMVEGAPSCGTFTTPPSTTFSRTGFTAVEWGVVLNWSTF